MRRRVKWRAASAASSDDGVLRTAAASFSADGGLRVLRGNLGRAVIPAAIHVSPECLAGRRLGKVRHGDIIRLDANAGTREALVTSEEWAQRVPSTADLTRNQLKLFPAQQAGGIAMLKALGGPFPQAMFCPTGGIDADSAQAFLALPNVLCIGGSWLTPASLVANKDWRAIELRARAASLFVTNHGLVKIRP